MASTTTKKKETKANTTNDKTSRRDRVKAHAIRIAGKFELEKTFFTFLVIYIPVTWLFLGGTPLEETILLMYTISMALVAMWMLWRFAKYFAKMANDHSANYGDLFVVYFTNVFQALIGLKIFGYVVINMMPHSHKGLPKLLCDLFTLVKDLYWGILQYQTTLNTLIGFSFAAVVLFTLWSVGRKN